MPKASRIAILAGSMLFAVLMIIIWRTAWKSSARPLEPLRFCETKTTGVLGTLAMEKGFFREQGLDVSMSYYPLGRSALKAMLAGDCDMAKASETPVMFESFKRQDFLIVATTSFSTNYGSILARRDRGIEKVADLKGKRIGAMEETAGEFFLYRFLMSQRLAQKDVKVTFSPSVAALKQGLLHGEFDAISLWQPDVSEIEQQLGAKGVRFTEPDLVLSFATLLARRAFLEQHPRRVSQALKAFQKAEDLLAKNRPEAERVLAKRAGEPVARASKVVDSLGTIRLSLDQALLLTLEDEADWAVSSGRATGRVPNYLSIVDVRPLEKVKPEDVTILH